MKSKLLQVLPMAALLFLISLIPYSCKKGIDKVEIESEATIQKTLNSWFQNEIDTMNPQKARWVSMLRSSLDMKKAYVESEAEKDRQHTIIPLSDKFESSFNKNRERTPYLILTTTRGRIIANVAMVKTSASVLPDNLFTTIFRDDKSPIDIDYILLKTFDRYMFSATYRNSKPYSFTRMTTLGNSDISTNADCTEWYWRTTYYNADGTVDHYVDETVAIVCDNCTPDDPMCVDTGDGWNPEGGGGGGGSSGGGSEEDMEAAYMAAMLSTESTSASKSVTFTSPVEGKKPFTWIVIKNSWDLWRVNSNDEAVGYSSPSTGAVIYRIDHLNSAIAGQTVFSKTGSNNQQYPLIYLTWSETGHSSTIASDYHSGTIAVSGTLKNFAVPVSSHSQTCTVNAQ